MPYKSKKVACDHAKLRFSLTEHATEAGYSRRIIPQQVTATTPTGTIKKASKREINYSESQTTFPAPLILPDDDLSLDPKYPPQSLRSWIREKDRNEVTPERRTIYLAASPAIDPKLDFVNKWTQPRGKGIYSKIKQPDVQAVLSYLESFYHGLPVQLLPSDVLSFTDRIEDDLMVLDSKTEDQCIIGLDTKTSSGCKGIRTRSKSYGEYSHQMNLNDLLDAAILALPDDAYALLLLVGHDLYEDEDDEFVCGRAYGGSRVAVISTARYHPGLDRSQGVEREHAWPASHCEDYLQACCHEAVPAKPSKRKNSAKNGVTEEIIAVEEADADFSTIMSPMEAAVSAHNSLSSLEASPSAAILSGLWLGRVCRTASHELGHCFGMDHCVFYACSMQGSASIIEDARQPPYLCPVDLAKVLKATAGDMKERYQALLTFCDGQNNVHLFASYGAWIRVRLEELVERQ